MRRGNFLCFQFRGRLNNFIDADSLTLVIHSEFPLDQTGIKSRFCPPCATPQCFSFFLFCYSMPRHTSAPPPLPCTTIIPAAATSSPQSPHLNTTRCTTIFSASLLSCGRLFPPAEVAPRSFPRVPARRVVRQVEEGQRVALLVTSAPTHNFSNMNLYYIASVSSSRAA